MVKRVVTQQQGSSMRVVVKLDKAELSVSGYYARTDNKGSPQAGINYLATIH